MKQMQIVFNSIHAENDIFVAKQTENPACAIIVMMMPL